MLRGPCLDSAIRGESSSINQRFGCLFEDNGTMMEFFFTGGDIQNELLVSCFHVTDYFIGHLVMVSDQIRTVRVVVFERHHPIRAYLGLRFLSEVRQLLMP